MAGFYLDQLESLLSRVHPGIRAVSVGSVGNDACKRRILAVRVTADPGDHEDVLAALRRSEPSLRPDGFDFEYSCSAP